MVQDKEAGKGGTQRAATEADPKATPPAGAADAPPPGGKATPLKGGLFKARRSKNAPMREADDEESGEKEVQRQVGQSETGYPVLDFKGLDLETRPNPKGGYHYELQMMLSGMHTEAMTAVADSGADSTTISKNEVDERVYKQKEMYGQGKLDFPRAMSDSIS